MSWQDQAACAGKPSELFFVDRWGAQVQRTIRDTIKTYCDKCPVKPQCLQAGLHEHWGVWGGTTPKERKTIRNQKDLAGLRTMRRSTKRSNSPGSNSTSKEDT